MPQFSLAPLEADQLDQAYPLVRMALPQVSLAEWRSYAAAIAGPDSGVLTLLAQSGAIHALAAYRALASLHHGRALTVDLFVAFELSRKAPARSALCAGLHRIAAESDCRAVLFTSTSRGLVHGAALPPEPVAIANPPIGLRRWNGRGDPLARSG